jgi:hypothetical protein
VGAHFKKRDQFYLLPGHKCRSAKIGLTLKPDENWIKYRLVFFKFFRQSKNIDKKEYFFEKMAVFSYFLTSNGSQGRNI